MAKHNKYRWQGWSKRQDLIGLTKEQVKLILNREKEQIKKEKNK